MATLAPPSPSAPPQTVPLEGVSLDADVPCAADDCPAPAAWRWYVSCGCPPVLVCDGHHAAAVRTLRSGQEMYCMRCGTSPVTGRYEHL